LLEPPKRILSQFGVHCIFDGRAHRIHDAKITGASGRLTRRFFAAMSMRNLAMTNHAAGQNSEV
jgi:hypothetical protein